MDRKRIKRFFTGAASLLISLPALAGPEIDIPVEKFVLKNGLTVLVHEDRKAPIVAVGVWYHVGSKDEPAGKTGFAHLFEHIMFEGSEHYNDRMSKPLEQVGATSLNGTTWMDRTNFFENVPTPALELALWLESDRMGHLLGVLTQEKLDQERGVVENEKRQADNQPYGKVSYRVLENLFPVGHPYRHATIGSMADLGSASLEDVHQWFNDYYGASNAVLVLAGDIGAQRGKQLAEEYFGDIPSGPPLARMKTWVPDRSENTHEVMYDRVSQARIYRVWAVPGWVQKDRMLLQLAASVLGDGKNSRLYLALVRELQLAVDVSVDVQPFELASLLSVETTLAPGSAMDQANDIIDQELERFLRDGPAEDELTRAKTKINAGIIKGLERVGGFYGKASTLAQSELYDGNPEFFKTAISWITHATAAEVQDAARRWLSRGYHQLDVLPFGSPAATDSGIDRSTGLPEVSALPELDFPKIQRASLDNGIDVVFARRSAVPVVSLSMQFDAGYAADAGLKPGTASFALAMMDESTRTRSALEIEAEAEILGAEISTGSDLDTSRISLSALTENLAPSIALWADVIRNPAFTQDELDRLRKRWLAGIEREKNQPLSTALRILPPLIYGDGHAYGIPFTGSGTVQAVSDLTRDDLVSFHQAWIRPDNATLFVVGDTSLEEVLPLLEEQFSRWEAPAGQLPQKDIATVSMPERSRLMIIDKPDSPQSLILAAHVAPPTGVGNNIEILMMNDVIGGNFSARVNQNLRVDKQWSYGALTLLRDARGQRPWIVYAPVQSDRTAAAVSELLKEFNRFLGAKPATPAELDRVYRSKAFSLPGRFETSSAVLDALQSNQRFGRPDDYVSSLRQLYGEVDLEGIRQAAEQVLHPDRITWVIVGNRSEIESSLEKLDIADLEFMDADGNLVE